ncbi:MAG: neutral/alkaline non-lysosomal ceramidase N-terminal domain-containing protein [Candidatus Hydrogenedentes bacterium]|nr:neutral/alkaline non-lysosomal ceramidase N-terminal domain-containing protein [Candidatus Hydrogenedentota bacterium]
MSRFKKVLLGLALFAVSVVLLVAILIGPWPAYSAAGYADSGYYKNAVAAIAEEAAARNTFTDAPGLLQAGWASRDITPEVGVPMAGYSARPNGKVSEGVRDPLHVRALALSDGQDTLVLVGSDMLITPPNIAEMVRERVAAKTPLLPANVLFNASHTHCGPGGFAPGFASKVTGGEYDPAVPEFLAIQFTDAIVEAYGNLAQARVASGSVDAPQYIRNRMRDNAPVDSELSYLVAEQQDGARCYLVSYSAHPTTFGSRMMRFSAEYPGELMKHLETETKADAVYLGGAVGSMGPRAPEGPDEDARVAAMGQALAKLVLENTQTLQFEDKLDVAAVGVPVGLPSMQMRPFEGNTSWRLSPFAGSLLGVPKEGWIHGGRVGKLFFVGLPCDFSGEISIEWKAWAAGQGLDLWTLSFCAAYCGYFSPDKYYHETPLNYEMGLMNWYGPENEAYFTDLFHHVKEALFPAVAP